MTTSNFHTPIPAGTRVLNTTDGEPGSIVSAVAYDPVAGAWTDYEVETKHAIERCNHITDPAVTRGVQDLEHH